MEKLEAAIEAILFSAGDSVETGRIAKAIGQDKTTTEKIIRNMMLKYNARDRGIRSWSWMEHFSCVPNRSIMNIWWRLHCSQRKQY